VNSVTFIQNSYKSEICLQYQSLIADVWSDQIGAQQHILVHMPRSPFFGAGLRINKKSEKNCLKTGHKLCPEGGVSVTIRALDFGPLQIPLMVGCCLPFLTDIWSLHVCSFHER